MKPSIFFLTVFFLLVGWIDPLSAQSASVKQDGKSLAVADIQQKIQAAKDKSGLAEESRTRMLSYYQDSLEHLQELADQETQAAAFRQALKSLPVQAKQLDRQIADLENALKNRKIEKFALYPTDELEQRLIIEKTRLSDMDAEIAQLEGQINEQVKRPQQIREKSAELKNRLTNLPQEQLAINAIVNKLEQEARNVELETRARLINATIKTLELEILSDPLRLQTQKATNHLLNLQREKLTLLVGDLDNFLLERRQLEIDKEQAALLQAEKEAEGKHPLIRTATKENTQYNRLLQDINKGMEQYLAQKNDLETRYKQVEKDFQSAEQKIDLAGLSPALGNLLREQRRNLPQRKNYQDLNDTLQQEIALSSLELFKLDEAKKSLSDVNDALLARMSGQLSPDMADAEKLRIRTELRMLLNDQKDLVTRLGAVYVEFARVLGDVDFTLQQLLTVSEKFGAYLDQRLLWVPSAPVINKYYLNDIVKSFVWFLAPGHWWQVLVGFWGGIARLPVALLLGMAAVFADWRFRRQVKISLKNLLMQSNKVATNTFGYTLYGLGCILLLSLTLPIVLLWISGVILLNNAADFFSRSFAEGLIAAAPSLLVIQFFYRLFKPEGVAETLFHWQQHTLRTVARQLEWLRFVAVPAVFLIAMTGSDVFSEHSYALGRTALIILLAALAYVFHCFAHPRFGLAKYFYQHAPNSWLTRLNYVWYAIVVSAPLVIIGFAVAGYYQSALELQQKLVISLRWLFVAALFHALVIRWMTVTNRQLALKNAKQKRRQHEHVALGEGGGHIEEELLDISKINAQGQRLLTTLIVVILMSGAWLIWSDILPALSIFDQVVLWEQSQLIDGQAVKQPVTLINLFLCLVYAGLTIIFVNNFPGLVDLLSVGRFAMSAGGRYALIHLVRYLIVGIAFLAIANELGGSWSQVQWLVAALGVGLGFGLQEIFANMVSGIILLFERPIRVGDMVTVGEVNGMVSRIQMRATHIIDGDQKELIVPNKTFITDRLINWTLSDTVTRVVVPVGIAYGADIDLAQRVFDETVKSIPLILKEPSPAVLFSGFGESSLDFSIRVFVRDLADRNIVIHELHQRIYHALQQHHIEIPYPQRDVHIRSVAPGIVK